MTRERPAIRVTTAGEPVEVAIPESPTTGYRWVLADGADAVEVLSASFTPDPGRLAGGGGTRTFRLELRDPDGAELVFLLRRMPAGEPLERQVVIIGPSTHR